MFYIRNLLFCIHCLEELPIRIKLDHDNHNGMKITNKDKLYTSWAITCLYSVLIYTISEPVSDKYICVTCLLKYMMFNVKSIKKDVFSRKMMPCVFFLLIEILIFYVWYVNKMYQLSKNITFKCITRHTMVRFIINFHENNVINSLKN